ncbi:aldo/keto reductase [Metabacillus rhizolycopersici]|uniref:Aldo/keto reductase n=1 Tax=Metabacillus rhizolycopersici TaxID=2875709 RepID=A0ABS7UZZ5_9BACI|nr:aldo/keto reductase [Metabacillus rhizolycopersici]MBZ5753512.1 aldo/keto reductase [Metabacillus rhizolycopersici]
MEYVKFGNTGLDVSRLTLGCMSFGEPDRGYPKWTLGEEESRPILKKALDLGINFFDTANFYSDGTCEEIVGKFLREYTNRDELVLATKVYFPMHEGPNGKGLSRKHIMREIDKSLKSLGTDYVDLYQIHRWDYGTPIEETMEALHDVVKAGKARYIGASSMMSWQFLKANNIAEKNGWTKFVSMQNHFNLLYREEEREMLPLCKEEKIAVIPWSPLAKGKLTRNWEETSARWGKEAVGQKFYPATSESDRQVVERVAEVAEKRGVPRAQIALAWVLQKDTITSPIVGSTKASHLEDAAAALSIKLTAEEIAYMEEPYVPHPVLGLD